MKVGAIYVLLALIGLLAVPGRPAVAQPLAFETKARAAIMIDHRSGAVLFAKNPDERLPPASMSKLMTAYMVFDAIRADRLSEDDELPVSEKAWRTGGSKMFVKVGDRVKVHDLIRGVIIQSGNDACVVLAEGLAGSEEAFARRMTDRGREIGLTGSNFANSNGLPDPNHWMTVRDLATLANRLIAEFPEQYPIYSEEEFTYQGIRQFTRNPLLRGGVPGVDGLKTGHTEEAGYGLVASAARDGRRIILVMAGLESEKERSQESARMLEYGFREFEEYILFRKDQQVEAATVWLGTQATVPLVPAADVGMTMARDARPSMSAKVLWDDPVPAPVTKGQPLANLVISVPGSEPVTVSLVAGSDVPAASWFARIWSLGLYYAHAATGV
ncbi:MAG TPA: D-alanyl-D-alanine carboxypeptidase family protein [Geminicoccus sp.]|jgi:D-alanyl-D-alanine carboxypeptidase (penicillin-binding protein 5/6)|uniref:D-alanyl-D-alanine carboxypeptidase family protein n=1 Tax=Geminicoccus sp. TaxID=2024832 RepID=UPI002E32993E|nr:D-alanyl-D-alanine carboxypeptidase family protein [Geminicoccus sp.]HEX2529355.1 D-alanyl-D-alanine carboxypeptidase family protein [Geminicoccus sp.]